MWNLSRGLVACSLAATLLPGCSSQPRPVTDAATEVGAGVGAATDTCQGIRNCLVEAGCKTDIEQPCVQNCIARGSPAAQATYQALAACTALYCPTGDSYCGCEQHCFVDGNCLAETEACVAGGADFVCDTACH
jgi:hypothetical protein